VRSRRARASACPNGAAITRQAFDCAAHLDLLAKRLNETRMPGTGGELNLRLLQMPPERQPSISAASALVSSMTVRRRAPVAAVPEMKKAVSSSLGLDVFRRG
jgi:hypothetical protein